jgi:hypothetical protein
LISGVYDTETERTLEGFSGNGKDEKTGETNKLINNIAENMTLGADGEYGLYAEDRKDLTKNFV